MNRRLSSILFVAFVVAALSSYLVYRVAKTTSQRPRTNPIIVAARNLDVGAVIRAADLTTGAWLGPLPKGAIVSKDAAVGRGVVSAVYQGEPVWDSRLAPLGAGGGLAATIRPGMRACAVRVNEVVGVGGFVAPGMRVDVIISGTLPGSGDSGPKVKTLLQNVEVLSAGTNLQRDNGGKPVQVPVVNLLVTPDQAELLSLASNETRIQLVLRNPLDKAVAKTPGIALASLFSDGNTPPPPPKPKPVAIRKAALPHVDPPPPAPRSYLVEVINGSKRSEEKFAAPDQQ
ncbi:MAG TPA: Flp pilus assembly protein CpaB [Bryobacteraceae bacterium]|jgi:pilus assembly protein CpaB|nr:Flp pilus assembly protein CpaB [Bryobacteraceae bacterium]